MGGESGIPVVGKEVNGFGDILVHAGGDRGVAGSGLDFQGGRFLRVDF